ncbi:beta and beta-prime subunits of DNA dependent RNA-polymerase [Clavulina sp. PMI_390]|nr:beta and beta-prime subunits of DNA dependent RNA-polymerase [Clavulina sp. PMI_390]
MKDIVKNTNPRKIKEIHFGLFSAQDAVNLSELEVTHPLLYRKEDPTRRPEAHGVLDSHLGPLGKTDYCATCGLQTATCPGHFAYIKLLLPVFNVGYFKHIITILQNVCKTCSRVLLSENDRRTFLRRFRATNLENLTRLGYAKSVNTACRKVGKCPYCSAVNGTVKKAGAIKIIHDQFRMKKSHEARRGWEAGFISAAETQREVKQLLGKAFDDLNPLKVLDIFRRITNEDCELMGMNPSQSRPEHYLWQYISVPPVCIRPSVAQDGGSSNEDDITVILSDIAMANTVIKAGLTKGTNTQTLMSQWEALQTLAARLVNSELPGLAPGDKTYRGFCQRLKGKQGRFRGNLSGKRVDFSGRTVISPDPNLRIDEVAVPERVAKILTYPERVTLHNISRLRIAILNGHDVHPGANYVISATNGFKKYIKFGDRKEHADRLQIGDTVERHVIDGDIVLFNRQPSLHKAGAIHHYTPLSIMSHRAKVRPWRTFRLNECVCNPYNADFDGDEMNLHVPQTEEARTEALTLMGVKHNIVTPRNGEPVIAAIQDFITAAFLLSRKDRFYDRRQFTQICTYMADANLKIDIPPPAILKPKRLWTGKQIFNCIMRPNQESNVLVNLESKCTTLIKPDLSHWPKGMKPAADLSPNDGWLVIVNSEIMCGVFDKATVGGGKKKSMFGIILRDYGPDAAAVAMGRLAKVAARWLANIGFSLGINDVIPGRRLQDTKNDLVTEAYRKCGEILRKAREGKLETSPGSTVEETLESKMSAVLSKVRDDVGQQCMKQLSRHNAPLIMATCGSKGSTINVSQMVAVVGQQIIAGKRVANGFQDRTLPHFRKGEKDPPAKGFVRNSFFSGLSPTEFLFHAISGREGLVDTAVKTAETGYMARRLMKALEDLTTRYDLTVRNSVGGIVQFQYGADALDPACLEGEGTPTEFVRVWSHALVCFKIASHLFSPDKSSKATENRSGLGLMPFEIESITDKELASRKFRSECTAAYISTIRTFIAEICKARVKSREKYGVFDGAEQPPGHDEFTDYSSQADVAQQSVVDNLTKVTKAQLLHFLRICLDKYVRAKIEPGSTVGAVGAQSIGEPGTQMTLKTFHFAGVASMNVTLGVPRIKEIINAAKKIATPMINAKLVTPHEEKSARIVKGRLEKTILRDVTRVIEETWSPSASYITLHIDKETISKLELELTLDQIRDAIVANKKLKIKSNMIEVHGDKDRIKVNVSGEMQYYQLRALQRVLPSVVVKGVPSLQRAVISVCEKTEKGSLKGDRQLLILGQGLLKVMTTDGVIGERTTSNDVMEVEKVLGIEAARSTIIHEIDHTMRSHGMTIDPRHVMLLGDFVQGQVLGITRFGVAKMKDSVLTLASFEKTTDHLFDASAAGKRDGIAGVSESIIMGKTAADCGTSMPSLVVKAPVPRKRRKLIFERMCVEVS